MMKIVNQLFGKFGKRLGVTLLLLAALSTLPTSPVLASDLASVGVDRDLIARLADADRTTRSTAAFELRLYGQSALPLLVKASGDLDPVLRRGAVIGLTLLPNPSMAMETLLTALNDMDMGARSMAAHGLAIIGKPAAQKLADTLLSMNFQARDAAAFGLKMMGKKAVPALTSILQTQDDYARSKAAWLLGRMGKDALSATPALINALNTQDERAMHIIAEAIDLIAPEPAMVAFHLIQIDNKTIGCPAQRIGADAAPTLTRLLSRPGTPLAQIAFRTLAAIGDGAKPALRTAIASGSEGQRIAAALLLVEIDPDEVFTLPEDVRNTLANVPRKPKQ